MSVTAEFETVRDYPIHTRVLIKGVQAPDTDADLIAGKPTILDGLQFVWGRTTSVDQPDPGTCQFVMHVQLDGTEPATPMLDVIKSGDKVEVWCDFDYPTGDGTTTTLTRLCWSGFVVSAQGQTLGSNAFQVNVSAADPAAPLANETIGDTPWAVQTVQTRANRILQLSQTDTTPILVADTVADTDLTWRDVDAQPVLGLLQDVAQSVGGVLWVAADATRGTYLWMEDPSGRLALRKFVIDPTTGQVTIGSNPLDIAQFPANDLLNDPPQWTQDETQAINSVDVTWQEQGAIDPDTGQPTITEKTVTVTDGAPDIVSKLSVGTELTSQLDAEQLAIRLLAMAGGTDGWTGSGISIDTTVLTRDLAGWDYLDRLTRITNLLDGVGRLGQPLTLTGMPGWTPGGDSTSMYVEGGTYTVTNRRWQLELVVSTSTGQGQSATFADFNDTDATVDDFQGAILVRDAAGVAGPTGTTGTGFGLSPFGVTGFGQ